MSCGFLQESKSVCEFLYCLMLLYYEKSTRNLLSKCMKCELNIPYIETSDCRR